MDTADRFMIMGLCLQGILANPNQAIAIQVDDGVAALNEERMRPLIALNIRLAHLYADALAPQPEAPALATKAIELARICYEAVRVSGMTGKDTFVPLDATGGEPNIALEVMFELVAERLAGRRVDATTPMERMVFTIVDAAVPPSAPVEEPEADLFDETQTTRGEAMASTEDRT